MRFANALRVIALGAACAAAAGSATSTSNTAPNAPPQQNAMSSPPPAQQMDPARALGLWKSTFGAVKIEADNSKGGIQSGAVQGVWMYQRRGEDVVGYFAGSLHGNVLQFTWQEPNNPPLTGQGYLVFEPSGRQYSGRWWSDHHDRVGDWNGWRTAENAGYGAPQPANAYGGQPYGGAPNRYAPPPQQPPYGQPQPQPYQPQPYPPQPQPYQQPQPQPYQPYPAQPGPQPQPQPYGPQPAQPNPYGPSYGPQQPAPAPPPQQGPTQPQPQPQPRYY